MHIQGVNDMLTYLMFIACVLATVATVLAVVVTAEMVVDLIRSR